MGRAAATGLSPVPFYAACRAGTRRGAGRAAEWGTGPRPAPAAGGPAQPAKFSAYSLRTSGSVTKSIGTVPSTAGPPLRPAAEA